MVKLASYLLSLVVVLAPTARVQTPITVSKSVDGNFYRDMMKISGDGELMQITYIRGVIDGYFASTAFGAPIEGPRWVHDCLKEMPPSQWRGIFNHYLDQHPETWHKSAGICLPCREPVMSRARS
jgi:hypothetical protein